MEPRWIGTRCASAVTCPCRSKIPVEQAARSLMFVENAVRWSVAPISSAFASEKGRRPSALSKERGFGTAARELCAIKGSRFVSASDEQPQVYDLHRLIAHVVAVAILVALVKSFAELLQRTCIQLVRCKLHNELEVLTKVTQIREPMVGAALLAFAFEPLCAALRERRETLFERFQAREFSANKARQAEVAP